MTKSGSLSKRNSVSSIDKRQNFASEKALEKVPQAYDESKILQGKKLFFAFVAMLLSVLLIALGAFPSYIFGLPWAYRFAIGQTKLSLPPLCEQDMERKFLNFC